MGESFVEPFDRDMPNLNSVLHEFRVGVKGVRAVMSPSSMACSSFFYRFLRHVRDSELSARILWSTPFAHWSRCFSAFRMS
jgi:hypothetical protein